MSKKRGRKPLLDNSGKLNETYLQEKYRLEADLRFILNDIKEAEEIYNDLLEQKEQIEKRLKRFYKATGEEGIPEIQRKRGRPRVRPLEASGEKRKPGRPRKIREPKPPREGKGRTGRVSRQATLGINLEEEILNMLRDSTVPLSLNDILPHLVRKHKEIWSESYLNQVSARILLKFVREGKLDVSRDPEGGKRNYYSISGSDVAFAPAEKIDFSDELVLSTIKEIKPKGGITVSEIAENLKRRFPSWPIKRLKNQTESSLEKYITEGNMTKSVNQNAPETEAKYWFKV
jgi:hypothetical protein